MITKPAAKISAEDRVASDFQAKAVVEAALPLLLRNVRKWWETDLLFSYFSSLRSNHESEPSFDHHDGRGESTSAMWATNLNRR